MKKFLSATVALALLAGAGAASAQPNDRYDGRHDNRPAAAQRHDNGRDQARDGRHFDNGRYQRPAGYQHRQWRRGDRLPSSYRSANYRVDYHRYGLRAPPRGYQYVRVDNNVVLTAVATGVISSVIVDLFRN